MIEFLRYWFPAFMGAAAGWFIVRSFWWKRQYKELDKEYYGNIAREMNRYSTDLEEKLENVGAFYHEYSQDIMLRFPQKTNPGYIEIINLSHLMNIIAIAINNHDIKVERKDGKIRVWKEKEYPKIEAECVLEEAK